MKRKTGQNFAFLRMRLRGGARLVFSGGSELRRLSVGRSSEAKQSSWSDLGGLVGSDDFSRKMRGKTTVEQ